MSATGVKPKSDELSSERLPYYQINPSYTVRVICCVLFIFLTEICLAHYVYRLINSEIREEYVSKHDFSQHFVAYMRSDAGRIEIGRLFKEIDRVEENVRNSSSRRKKRGALPSLDENSLNEPSDGPNVEFFDPKLKPELEAKDEKKRQQTGLSGAAPGGDTWVWLTSYSRIPMAAIQGFCSATKDYCPPGKMGPIGPPGTSGVKGERGDTGFPGIPGPVGPRGHPGYPGEKGSQGRPGHDGRDGVPGEPGFDGMPGRNGLDGSPGIDGIPGIPGFNGTDGRPGLPGPQGPPGPIGPKGLTGPRGKTGRPGNHGTPGIPGVKVWSTRINGTDLLIPPSIAGAPIIKTYVVREMENLKLTCPVHGVPKPTVTWQRIDNNPMVMGSWKANTVSQDTYEIPQVNRMHMGIYQCIANNGVPPQANQTYKVEVQFAPLIRIRNQMVGAANGTTARLECEVEAFPEAIRYWERSDGRLLENGPKFNINNNIEKDGYKTIMQLNITSVSSHDFMSYHCVAKNDLSQAKGIFTLYQVDPNLATPPPVNTGQIMVFGEQAPHPISMDDICPPPAICPECPIIEPPSKETHSRCRDVGLSLIDLIKDWKISALGETNNYPGYNNRATDCVLYAVGKPVFHHDLGQYPSHGWWMRDPLPKKEVEGESYYVTKENNDRVLFKYANKDSLRNGSVTNITLQFAMQGNTHVVYNGSFYYNQKGTAKIIKMNLTNQNTKGYIVPMFDQTNSLYNSNYSYMDFSVDDNGLWIIYGIENSTNTAIMKADANSLEPQYIWNISLDHRKVGEMFVVCGVLYAIDSVTDFTTRIRFALDLYKNTLLDVSLPFSNPFKRTAMVGYNHKHKELYTFDKGNLLTYPVRYHEIGYNITEDKTDETSER